MQNDEGRPREADREDLGMLPFRPIGVMRTAMRHKFDAPPQPDGAPERAGRIELVRGMGLEEAVRDLEGFSRIWLVWWFHRNTTWRPLVLPPRGPAKRRGVFATRSPHRPNPIGITSVPLLRVEGLTLHVGSNDLVDGTPILDIKPYLPAVDAHPAESIGWLAAVEAELRSARFVVVREPLAEEQVAWLHREWGVEFISRATELLAVDPSPHRTRRIMRLPDGRFRMACGGWRLYFVMDSERVVIEEIRSGYADRMLFDTERYTDLVDRPVHLAFRARWSARNELAKSD